MTRIIAGSWRGRHLTVPRAGVRPTSERVREAVFNTLTHELGTWDGLVVVDLFAGSGALGLEAVSRGAARAVLVERDRGNARTIRTTVAQWGVDDEVSVVVADATVSPRAGPEVDVLFADPPYDLDRSTVTAALAAWRPRLAAGAVAVVETAARGGPLDWPAGFRAGQDRRYGDTRIWYGRTASEPIDKD